MDKKFFQNWFFLLLTLIISSLLCANMAIGLNLQLKVKVDSATIRLDASEESPVVGTVSKGEIFVPESEKGDWYLITLKDKETGFNLSGYIHKGDVEVMGEVEAGPPIKEKVLTVPPIKEEMQAAPIREESIFEEKRKNASKGFPLSFYLSGNYRFVNPSDLNTWIDNYEDIYSDEDDYFTWDKLKNVPEFNFEIIYNMSDYFGIGLGIGYLFRSNNANLGWEDSDGDYVDNIQNIGLNALVFSGNIHGNIPLGKSFALNLTAGGDYYLGKYKLTLEQEWDYWYTTIWWYYWYPILVSVHSEGDSVTEEDATCNTFGFHVGAAFDIKISPNIAFVVGGFYRFVKFNDFYGTYNYTNEGADITENEEGYLWFNTENPYMGVFEDEPTWDDWRKAVIDLSGFSFQVGIRISNLFSKKK